ncbi:MAG: CAP domain-containing protein [Patescibacteria group bacterium]
MRPFFVLKIFLGVLASVFFLLAFFLNEGNIKLAPEVAVTGRPNVSVVATNTPNIKIPTPVSASQSQISTQILPPRIEPAKTGVAEEGGRVMKEASPERKISAPGPLILASTSPRTAEVNVLDGDAIVSLTNAERAKAGLPPLYSSKRLLAMAEAKALDMIEKQYFAHVAPNGADIALLAKKYGYEFLNVGENLARGDFYSSAHVVSGWMNSPGHRANILNEEFTEIGVAALRGSWDGVETWYAVQEFGRPLSACPGPEPLLRQKIAIYQNEIIALETTLKNFKVEIETSAEGRTTLIAKINDYNKIIELYNGLVSTTKTSIDTYNAEVQAFNACAGF